MIPMVKKKLYAERAFNQIRYINLVGDWVSCWSGGGEEPEIFRGWIK